MAREIAKTYEPQQIEPRWAEYWVKEELYKADAHAPGPVFSIVIPPPNVTGSLHIGHMLEHTEIDILIRIRYPRVRMSISVCSSMCPMCSEPVQFGGGMTIENTGPGACASALYNFSFTQDSAQRGSICCGSYVFAISRAIR